MSRMNRRTAMTAILAAGSGMLRPGPPVLGSIGALPLRTNRDPTILFRQDVPLTPVAPGDGSVYDAYIPTAVKSGQYAGYTCEFDAAWVVLKTFGLEVTFEEQLASIGLDTRQEPYHVETTDGVIVYGGDITAFYSGDYTKNFLARTTGPAMRKVFDRYQFDVTPVNDRSGIEAALLRGALVWIKTTVDFLPWIPVTWMTPEGTAVPGVLGNDHAVVVSGYNAEVVLIRDVLGPTSSNWERPYEYAVRWETFLPCWEAQAFDGLAVSRGPLTAPANDLAVGQAT